MIIYLDVALRSTFFQLGMFQLLCSKSSHSSISQALIKCRCVSQIVNPHKMGICQKDLFRRNMCFQILLESSLHVKSS
jgi:hypothetical protein